MGERDEQIIVTFFLTPRREKDPGADEITPSQNLKHRDLRARDGSRVKSRIVHSLVLDFVEVFAQALFRDEALDLDLCQFRHFGQFEQPEGGRQSTKG